MVAPGAVSGAYWHNVSLSKVILGTSVLRELFGACICYLLGSELVIIQMTVAVQVTNSTLYATRHVLQNGCRVILAAPRS